MEISVPCYVVIIAHKIDRAKLRPYIEGLSKAYEPFKGLFEDITAKTGVEFVEGQKFEALQIVRWSSKNDFERFYYSETYTSLRKLREEAGEFSISIIPSAN